MPSPVSRTTMRARVSKRSSVTSTWPPGGVNFTAFDTRLVITCCNRSGSPRTGTRVSGSEVVSRTPLAAAAGRMRPTAASTDSATSVGPRVTRHSPETIRETSSRSSISCACVRALCSIAPSATAVLSVPSSPVRSMLDHARIGVSGVRSSCETVARNSSFARLASSARSRAASVRSRYRCRSISACFRSVMSWTSIMTWSVPPCRPGRPRTEISASSVAPPLRTQRASRRSGAELPDSMRRSSVANGARSPGWTNVRHESPSSSPRV